MIKLKGIFNFVKRDEKIALRLFLILGIGFLLLTLFVYLLPSSFIDLEFSEEMQEHQNPFLDIIMKGISWFGSPWGAPILVLGSVGLLFFYAYRKEALYLSASLLAGVLSLALKVLVNRPRPTEDVVQVIENAKFQSFPSGHTMFYVAFFGFLTFLMYRLNKLSTGLRVSVSLFSLFLIFTIPFSRVYLGAHWFTDVLGGFLMGLFFLVGMIVLYLKKPDGQKESSTTKNR